MFGRECQQFAPWGEIEDVDVATQLSQRAEALCAHLTVTEATTALVTTQQEQQRQQQDAQHHVSEETLEPGQKVWILLGGLRPGKLTPRYTGPYKIVRQASGGNYILSTLAGVNLARSVPREKIKRQRTDSIIDGHTVFRVDEILDQRKEAKTGEVQYLTKWSGYNVDEATWEPESSFIDLEPVDNYWRRVDAQNEAAHAALDGGTAADE